MAPVREKGPKKTLEPDNYAKKALLVKFRVRKGLESYKELAGLVVRDGSRCAHTLAPALPTSRSA